MADNTRPRFSIEIVIVIIGVVAIFIVIAVFRFAVTPPPTLEPTPTAIQPTSSPSGGYQPEVIPPLPDISSPTQIATSVPSNTPIPANTLLVIPTLVSSRQLPDLTVTGISDPVCVSGYENTVLEFTIFVRNTGRVSTRNFGSFDVGVFFILGQRRYSLDEWATQFDGVVGTSNMEVSNLYPNDDIKFTVVIDLKGNKNFGIEVAVNSGENPIREADMMNNTLIKYYSAACY